MIRSFHLLVAPVCLVTLLAGCQSDTGTEAVETRTEDPGAGVSAAVDEICALYADGEGDEARLSLRRAIGESEDRTREAVERAVETECGEAVATTTEQERAEHAKQREERQKQLRERDQARLAEQAWEACPFEPETGIVCIDGIAIDFEDGTCELDEDPFHWLGTARNMTDEPLDVTVIVEVVDGDDDVRLSEGSAVIRNLEPDGEAEFKALGTNSAGAEATCQLADVRVREP